jgi:hypothetical protein
MLSKEHILDEMAKPLDPLVVTPLLERSQVGDASVDVRLGHEFIVLRGSSVSHIDPTKGMQEHWDSDNYRWQERVRISLFKLDQRFKVDCRWLKPRLTAQIEYTERDSTRSHRSAMAALGSASEATGWVKAMDIGRQTQQRNNLGPDGGQRVPAPKDVRDTSVMPSRAPNTKPMNPGTTRYGTGNGTTTVGKRTSKI